ncbi:MAG: hypothetical protein HIU84_12135 [Acidobacteria bacterium]|nr:hypothetical protein [Acidobacteriota bacterium]
MWIRKLVVVSSAGLILTLSVASAAGASTKQQRFQSWIGIVDKSATSYLASAAKVHSDTVTFVVSHRPTALFALSSAMSSDEKHLISAVAFAPSLQLKNVTLSFAKAVGVVSADVLGLAEPKLVPTLTMAKVTVRDMNRVIAIGNTLVADAQGWKRLNG